jgi:hypothetical protein
MIDRTRANIYLPYNTSKQINLTVVPFDDYERAHINLSSLFLTFFCHRVFFYVAYLSMKESKSVERKESTKVDQWQKK